MSVDTVSADHSSGEDFDFSSTWPIMYNATIDCVEGLYVLTTSRIVSFVLFFTENLKVISAFTGKGDLILLNPA